MWQGLLVKNAKVLLFLFLIYILLLLEFWLYLFGLGILIIMGIYLVTVFLFVIGRVDLSRCIFGFLVLFFGFYTCGMLILSFLKFLIFGRQDILLLISYAVLSFSFVLGGLIVLYIIKIKK
jgi:hypothetical protein